MRKKGTVAIRVNGPIQIDWWFGQRLEGDTERNKMSHNSQGNEQQQKKSPKLPKDSDIKGERIFIVLSIGNL